MEAKELRIGNVLTLSESIRNLLYKDEIWATKPFFKVKSIYDDDSVVLELDEENVEFYLKDVQDIPLTKEWLLKNSFESVDYESPFLKKSYQIFYKVY